MKDLLIYMLALFIFPLISAIVGFILLIILSPIYDFLKKHSKELFDRALFLNPFFASFLTVIIFKGALNVFALNLNWIFIILLAALYIINGKRREMNVFNQDRLFERYQTIADVAGILCAYIVL